LPPLALPLVPPRTGSQGTCPGYVVLPGAGGSRSSPKGPFLPAGSYGVNRYIRARQLNFVTHRCAVAQLHNIAAGGRRRRRRRRALGHVVPRPGCGGKGPVLEGALFAWRTVPVPGQHSTHHFLIVGGLHQLHAHQAHHHLNSSTTTALGRGGGGGESLLKDRSFVYIGGEEEGEV